jgi:hypothetical protein
MITGGGLRARAPVLRPGPGSGSGRSAADHRSARVKRAGRLRRAPPAAVVCGQLAENLSRSAVLPYGAMALARPVCGGPDGTALWPVPEAERGPRAPWGGDGAAGAPPLTRLAACPWGILWPGFSNSMPGSKRVQRGNFLCSQPRASSCREGCRERRLRALPRPSRPAGRSSFPHRPAGRPPMPGANRVAPGRPRGVRGTPLPFLPAWRSLAPSDVLARYQDFSNPDWQVWRGAGRTWPRESSSPKA